MFHPTVHNIPCSIFPWLCGPIINQSHWINESTFVTCIYKCCRKMCNDGAWEFHSKYIEFLVDELQFSPYLARHHRHLVAMVLNTGTRMRRHDTALRPQWHCQQRPIFRHCICLTWRSRSWSHRHRSRLAWLGHRYCVWLPNHVIVRAHAHAHAANKWINTKMEIIIMTILFIERQIEWLTSRQFVFVGTSTTPTSPATANW